jgi:tetrahydromethanopterin S-methyltransferase subunit G
MATRRNQSTETQVKNVLVPIIQAIGRSGKLIYLIVIGVVLFLAYQYFNRSSDTSTLEFNSALIEKQLKNVSKLVVTEGHYSQVMTYKDQKKYFMDMVSFEKKALMVVNTDVSISYDLSKVEYDIDEKNKTITIKNIPQAEMKINPDIHFYNIDESTFNPFGTADYNKINKKVRTEISKKLEKSKLKKNAQNRLLSELSKLLILTNTMGWTLKYEGEVIESQMVLKGKIKKKKHGSRNLEPFS